MGDVLLLLEQVAALPLCSTSMLPILCNNIHLIAALHILCILHSDALCRFYVFHMLCSASSLHLMWGAAGRWCAFVLSHNVPSSASILCTIAQRTLAQVLATGAPQHDPATTSAHQCHILWTAALIFCYIFFFTASVYICLDRVYKGSQEI